MDTITGTSGNDTIIADNTGTNMTLTAADQIAGGTGDDTIKVYVKDDATGTGQPTLSSVEHVYIKGGAIVDYTAASGTSSLSFDGIINTVAQDATYTLSGQDLSLANKTLTASAGAELKYTVAKGASATHTSQKITVDTITYTGTDKQTIDVTGALVNTLNLVTTGGASKFDLANSTGAAIKTINVSGDKNLTTTLSAAMSAAVTEINASTMTGNLSVDASAGTVAGTFKFTGGSGNDTITFADDALATLVAGTQLAGGDGTGDKIGIKDTTLSATELARINAATGFEVLGVNAGITVDAATLTNIKQFSVDTSGLTTVFNNLKTGSTVTVGANGTHTAVTAAVDTGVNDGTVKLGSATGTGTTVTTLTASTVRDLTIESNGAAGTTNVITTLNNGDNSNIVLKGSANLTVTNALAGSTGGSKLDANAFTGNLTVIGSAHKDILIGGSGADTLRIGTSETANAIINEQDILTGNGGADIFSFRVKHDTDAATNMANILRQSSGTDGIVHITDFTAGVDKISLIASATNAVGTSMVLATKQTITTADTIAAIYTGITEIGASTAGGALSGKLVEVSGGAKAGTYLYINNGTGGVASADDMLINLTGVSGTLSAADFTFGTVA